jgi:hypothetical protein
MTDETLQNMNTEEFELFMEVCHIEAEKIGVTVEYYLEEFV